VSSPGFFVLLRLTDPVFTERLLAFLRSVGQTAEIVGPGEVEVTTAENDDARAELEIYVRVWRVLNVSAEVTVT
jgi:hypothetical protein